MSQARFRGGKAVQEELDAFGVRSLSALCMPVDDFAQFSIESRQLLGVEEQFEAGIPCGVLPLTTPLVPRSEPIVVPLRIHLGVGSDEPISGCPVVRVVDELGGDPRCALVRRFPPSFATSASVAVFDHKTHGLQLSEVVARGAGVRVEAFREAGRSGGAVQTKSGNQSCAEGMRKDAEAGAVEVSEAGIVGCVHMYIILVQRNCASYCSAQRDPNWHYSHALPVRQT